MTRGRRCRKGVACSGHGDEAQDADERAEECDAEVTARTRRRRGRGQEHKADALEAGPDDPHGAAMTARTAPRVRYLGLLQSTVTMPITTTRR